MSEPTGLPSVDALREAAYNVLIFMNGSAETSRKEASAVADAMLALLPGRSAAEVKAEAIMPYAEALAHMKPEWQVLREAAGKLLLGTWPHELMPGVGAAARELDARAANLEAADGAGR